MQQTQGRRYMSSAAGGMIWMLDAAPQMITDALVSAVHAVLAELQRRVEKSVAAHHFLHE